MITSGVRKRENRDFLSMPLSSDPSFQFLPLSWSLTGEGGEETARLSYTLLPSVCFFYRYRNFHSRNLLLIFTFEVYLGHVVLHWSRFSLFFFHEWIVLHDERKQIFMTYFLFQKLKEKSRSTFDTLFVSSAEEILLSHRNPLFTRSHRNPLTSCFWTGFLHCTF